MGDAMDYKRLGRIVSEERKKMGLTQEELAEMIGISTAFVGHIERGTRVLSVQTLWRLCGALNLSSDFLLGIREHN